MLYLNNHVISVTMFPDKTSQVWKISDKIINDCIYLNNAVIKWEFENEAEFLHLAQLRDLLYYRYNITTTLEIIYLPYGRQDKYVSNTSTFGLVTFANLLNSLKFKSITCLDPHNANLTTVLIDNFYPIYPLNQVNDAFLETNSDLVCYPDKGANNKYTNIYHYPSIFGEKVRDQLTGIILNYELFGDCYNKNVLIVDDLCDGGMTFKLLCKQLLDRGAKEVNLFVTYGIFSKGIETLRESGIKRIFTHKGEIK